MNTNLYDTDMHKEVSRKQSAKMLIRLSLYFETKKNSILIPL